MNMVVGLQGCEISRNSGHPWQLKWPLPGPNWGCMTETHNSYQNALNLCYTSLTILTGEIREPVPQQFMTICFQWVTDLETVLTRAAIKYPVYQGKSEHNVQHVVLYYLVGR